MLESSRQIFSLEKKKFVDCQQTNDKGQRPNGQQANGLKNDLTTGTGYGIRARARARKVKVGKFQTRNYFQNKDKK